jgi:hypothetical protein
MSREARDSMVFHGAVLLAGRHGRKGTLLRLLRADHPLTAANKAQLADLIEGKIKPERGGHRTFRKLTPHIVAEENADRGARYYRLARRHRQRRRLKPDVDATFDLACRWLQEDWEKDAREGRCPLPHKSAVLNRIDRSRKKKRRH